MANKKRMYKRGYFPGMEPDKMLTFGGMKYQAGKPFGLVETKADPKKAPDYTMKPDKMEQIAGEAALRRGPSRQEKQNTPQGTGGGPKPKVSNKLDELSKAPGPKPAEPKPKPAEKATATKKEGERGTYSYAKKRNPNLDKLIAQRKKYDKGSAEYKKIQMQINDAYYGTGALKKVEEKTSNPPDFTPPGSSKKETPARTTPSGGSGMGAKQKEDELKAEIDSAKPVDRRTSSTSSSSSASSSSNASVADLKSQIKDAKKANKGQGQANRQAAKISRLQERLAKIQGKKMGGRYMKKGGFPDLNGDGKVTFADVLKGRLKGKRGKR